MTLHLISFHSEIIQNKSIKGTRCVRLIGSCQSPTAKGGGRITLITKFSSS